MGDAAHYLEIERNTLATYVKNNPSYGKWFWKVGTEYRTSPVMLLCMQMELVGMDLSESIREQAMNQLRKAA